MTQPNGFPPSNQFYSNDPQILQGQKDAKTSLILGIIGFFIFGFVLGPLAIMTAKKAEAAGVSATAGKAMGWITTIQSILCIIFVIISIIMFVVASANSHSY